jgi:hypothetical protein
VVYRVLEGGPKVLGGIGTPGTPTGAVLGQCPLISRQTKLLGGQPEAKIAGGKRIWVAEAPHRDHLCGPRANPGQGQ